MDLFKKFDNDFTRNVLKLLSGTVLASIITFLALPIITRLFSEAELGTFQIFYSTVLIFGGIASLKYELTIVLPSNESDANQTIAISTLLAVVLSILFLLAISFFGESLLSLLEIEQLSPYRYLIALGIGSFGLLQVGRYILIRNKVFNILARNNVYQALLQQGTTIYLGYLWGGFSGLVYGFLIGAIIPTLLVFKKYHHHYTNLSLRRMKALAWDYRKFPVINTSSVFLNNFSLELPVFMMAVYFDEGIVGLYALAIRLSIVPINLLGTSVSRVYFQAATEAFNQNTAKLLNLYKETVGKLALIGLIPLLVVITLAPQMVALIFGESWRDAGIFMQILAPALYVRFLNSPISTTFSIINRQEIGLVLIGISVVIRYLAMYLFNDTIYTFLIALSLATTLFYVTYNVAIYYYVRKLDALNDGISKEK